MQSVESVQSQVQGAVPGALDGWTILRFAHAYESGGGLEQYLADLNRVLGERNRLTVVQMQMTTDPSRLSETTETIGRSQLIKIPLLVPAESKGESINAGPPRGWEKFKVTFCERVLFAPFVYHTFTRHLLRRMQVRRRPGEPDNAGAKFKELLGRFPVRLVVLHSSAGADAAEILAVAAQAKIPVAIVHHFANYRFKTPALARQTLQVSAVAGVSDIDVPGYLRPHFTNLADGIDVDFFQAKCAKPLAQVSSDPILFLPARIMATKGQLDLVRAGGELLRRGIKLQIVLAGRVDSDEFMALLQREIESAGLTGRVFFPGQLDATGLRDWYAASAILAFPTHHHEGLGRILVEAQAMSRPVVVYDIGGTPEGVVDGQTGYLIPLGDQSALVNRLAELLRDPARCRQYGEAGRRFVEKKFSLESLADRHESFYLKALKP